MATNWWKVGKDVNGTNPLMSNTVEHFYVVGLSDAGYGRWRCAGEKAFAEKKRCRTENFLDLLLELREGSNHSDELPGGTVSNIFAAYFRSNPFFRFFILKSPRHVYFQTKTSLVPSPPRHRNDKAFKTCSLRPNRRQLPISPPALAFLLQNSNKILRNIKYLRVLPLWPHFNGCENICLMPNIENFETTFTSPWKKASEVLIYGIPQRNEIIWQTFRPSRPQKVISGARMSCRGARCPR